MNEQESKVLRVNPLKRDITIPEVLIPIISSTTILGVTFTSDCSLKLHVDSIVHEGPYSIQSLTSVRRLGISELQLLLAHKTYIRPILEHCCSVWVPQTHNIAYMSAELEEVEKCATKIILGPCFSNYESALELLNFPTLFDWRYELNMKFGESLLTNEKHQSILPPSTSISRNTGHNNKLEPVKCHAKRFANSFVPYFVIVANK